MKDFLTRRTMNGWMLPKNHPTTDREVLVLVMYARSVVEQEVGFRSLADGKWYYKGLPDADTVYPIMNRILAWRELPELPEDVEGLK